MNQRSQNSTSPSGKKVINSSSSQPEPREDVVDKMTVKIEKMSGLHEYKVRELVEDTQELGKKLARNLKTNQIRKFLDAVNRVKANLDKQPREQSLQDEQDNKKVLLPEVTRSELELLRPKLAYAAARQSKGDKDPGPVEPMRKVLEAAIKQVETLEDFNRLVQLIESIIAYHKAEGGKDQ